MIFSSATSQNYCNLIEDSEIKVLIESMGVQLHADDSRNFLKKLFFPIKDPTANYIKELNQAIEKRNTDDIEKYLSFLGLDELQKKVVLEELSLNISDPEVIGAKQGLLNFGDSTELYIACHALERTGKSLTDSIFEEDAPLFSEINFKNKFNAEKKKGGILKIGAAILLNHDNTITTICDEMDRLLDNESLKLFSERTPDPKYKSDSYDIAKYKILLDRILYEAEELHKTRLDSVSDENLEKLKNTIRRITALEEWIKVGFPASITKDMPDLPKNASILLEKMKQIRTKAMTLPTVAKECMDLYLAWHDKIQELEDGGIEDIDDKDIQQATQTLAKLEKLSDVNKKIDALEREIQKSPTNSKLKDIYINKLAEIRAAFYSLKISSLDFDDKTQKIDKKLAEVTTFKTSNTVEQFATITRELQDIVIPGSTASSLLNVWTNRLSKLKTASISAHTVEAAERAHDGLKKLKSMHKDTESALKALEAACENARNSNKALIELLLDLQSGLETIQNTELQLKDTTSKLKILDEQIKSTLTPLQKSLDVRIKELMKFKLELDLPIHITDEDQIFAKAISLGIGMGIGMSELAPKIEDAFRSRPSDFTAELRASLSNQITKELESLRAQYESGQKIIKSHREISEMIPKFQTEITQQHYAQASSTVETLIMKLNRLQRQIEKYRETWGYLFSNFLTLGGTNEKLETTHANIKTLLKKADYERTSTQNAKAQLTSTWTTPKEEIAAGEAAKERAEKLSAEVETLKHSSGFLKHQ